MAFDAISAAVRSLRGSLIFAAACLAWTMALVGAMLLARHTWITAAVGGLGAALVLAVPDWRRRRVSFAVLAVSLAAFLMVSEAIIRLAYFGRDAISHPLRYQPIGAMDDPAYLAPAPEPDVVYTLQPGFRGWVKGVLISANRFGLRDRDWPIHRESPSVIRVMTLGTSIAMGEGVPVDSTFTALLGEQLRARRLEVETLDFGVGGYTLGTAQALLRARGLQFHPDVVVQELTVPALGETSQSINDLRASFERTMRDRPPASLFEINSFALFAIYPPLSLRARLTAFASPRAAGRARPDGFVEATLARFGRLAVERHFLGVVFVPHPIHGFGDRTLDHQQRGYILRLATADGLIYVDSYDRFSASDQVESLSIFPSELHPNAEAHRRHAAALADALDPRLRQLRQSKPVTLQ
jgi:hypothetical protein